MKEKTRISWNNNLKDVTQKRNLGKVDNIDGKKLLEPEMW